MFLPIFRHELKYWFKKPSFYIYVFVFLIASLAISSGIAGFFNNLDPTKEIPKLVNSPSGIFNIYNTLTTLIYFLFPSIIGHSVYRDYKCGVYSILYSYPFTKANYLFAKFFSAITIVTIIVLVIGAGIFVGFRLPGIDANLVGSFSFTSYLQTYLIYIMPNILLYGAIIFSVVIFSRSILTGFIAFLVLLMIQVLMASLLSDHEIISALFNPSGASALVYYTKYWTTIELNTLDLPIKGFIIYNRLLWLSVSVLVFASVYKYFSFSQQSVSFSFKKVKGSRLTKSNFGSITKVNLPKIKLNFSFFSNLKTTWKLSNLDLRYIVKSAPFVVIIIVGVIVLISEYIGSQSFRGTYRLPVTWKMLEYSEAYVLATMICTFLYAGMLGIRSKVANVNLLVDSSPTPNWVFVSSRFLAIIKMQFIMLLLIMIVGISYQIYNGYTDFEISHYLFDLFVLNFSANILWAFLAILVQTLAKNMYIGLLILIVLFFVLNTPLISALGLEHNVFKYANGSWYNYSDMNGYGNYLLKYFIYRLYWLLAGLLFLIVSILFSVRGVVFSFRERLSMAKNNFKGKMLIAFNLFLILFVSMGYVIYSESNKVDKIVSNTQKLEYNVEWEKKYRKYEKYSQPRIVAVKVNFDIFPNQLSFDLKGQYTMVNKSEETIDSIFIKYKDYPSTFELDEANTFVSNDSIYRFNIYKLEKSLKKGDSVTLNFTIKSKPNTVFGNNSLVLENGTSISKSKLMPTIGYRPSGIKDNAIRVKYGLTAQNKKAHPSDSTALGNNLISRDADWIDFEATLSTRADQIAIAPGSLIREWIQDGRRYFNYKVDSKMLNIYSFNSGRYEVKKDKWNDVDLEIYYHKAHSYNLDRMMAGIKASLKYNSENFGDYQHKQLRIIEYPKTLGGGAQAYPSIIPFSESHGFIADVDDSQEGGIDYPFAVTVHEVSHQWWAHQVMGANVLGATMLTESLAEYVRLKALEKQHGKDKMYKFLKYASKHYLSGRKNDSMGEEPLMYNSGQQYIRYSKGAIVFYALSDYIGEKKLNKVLKNFMQKNKFKEAPYVTSIELVNSIRKSTPDSLKYIIKDMFETITLYDNKIVSFETHKLENGKYRVDIEFNISKYRTNKNGSVSYSDNKPDSLVYKSTESLSSLPLEDYIDIGVFAREEVNGKSTVVELYLEKHKITSINNKISIIVNEKPYEVGIDPYIKLIDRNHDDNRIINKGIVN